MFANKLTITKETKAQLSKGMGKRARGKVLFTRLQELDQNGTLSKALNRADVARLVGYPEERIDAGYKWVSYLISAGYLSETLQKWKFMGKKAYEYHTTGKVPNYDNVRKAKKTIKPVVEQPKVNVVESVKTPIKVEITRGDMYIKVELGGYEGVSVSELITTLLKGE